MLKNLSVLIGTLVAYEGLTIARRELRLRELEHQAKMKLLSENKEQESA